MIQQILVKKPNLTDNQVQVRLSPQIAKDHQLLFATGWLTNSTGIKNMAYF
jgi:hypothetical protein